MEGQIILQFDLIAIDCMLKNYEDFYEGDGINSKKGRWKK